MTMPKLERPSLGTVLGFTALVIAIGGTAHAATSHSTKTIIVRKGEIAKGAVTAKALAPGAVHAIALAKGAVQTKALATGAVNPRVIAEGAVDTAALAQGAVGSRALSGGAVGPGAIAPDAVTASALAPGSVYGGALGPVTIHTATMADLDAVAENGTWTASESATALCSAGERLLTGGIVFANPGNREVGVLEALPFSNATNGGITGRITSNSGGLAAAEVQAICLK
jgi:hypothetical protein